MDQDNYLGYFDKLSYHLIKYLSKFLKIQEAFKFSLTNKSIRELICIKKLDNENGTESSVRDNGIQLYLELDFSEIGHKVELIIVDVMTKDQGWASASYSTSWVSLQLFNDPNDVLTHAVQENEQIIHENYRQKEYKNRHLVINKEEIPLTPEQIIKEQAPKKSVLYYIRQGQFKKIGIVQKCQYPGWECYIKSAKIELWYREE